MLSRTKIEQRRSRLSRALRAARGDRSQREIAEAAGLTRVALARIELGSADPRWSTLVRLEAALGLPAGTLAG